MTRRNKILVGVLVVVLLLVGVRVALPFVVEDYVNGKLQTLQAYRGHIGDVDIHLWRGAYSIDDIVITKIGADRPVPFFKSDRLEFSVEWSNLMRGSVVSEASFLQPELNLVQAKSEKESQLGEEENWNARLEELFPFRFNTVEVHEGTVRFLAPGISTGDAITARRVNGAVSNLTNVLESGKRTFADFGITAEVLQGSPAVVAGSVDAFAAQPTFDVNMEVKDVALPQVNPWLREYIKADAEAGKFELYLELAASEGRFAGYAKPILEDVDLYRSGEQEESALKRIWEGFLDFAAEALENEEADQVAARIPFSGTIQNPQTSLLATISSVLRNAFVSAFARSLEGSITLRDVKKSLRAIGDEGGMQSRDDARKSAEKSSGKSSAESSSEREGGRKAPPGPAGKT
jgi:hypothetical protein